MRADAGVAREARLAAGLRQQEFRARRMMDGVAVRADHVIHGVFGALDVRLLQILGVAREVAALLDAPLRTPAGATVGNVLSDSQAVRLESAAACPKFVGRVIRGIDNTKPTPIGLRERLRRAGVRSISPAVDVTNYVLLELGQPMHAYDLAKVSGDISARMARQSESLTLLDGREVKLDADMLVIADEAGAVGAAGIMGGERTAVSATTRDVFLEVAWFAPEAIRGRARRLASSG